jgi:bacterioferritin
MKPRDPRIVDLLNEALTYELTITNTYFLHSRMLGSWGFPRLAKVFYNLSIDEMKDADSLIQRILMFDGHPNVQRLSPIVIGESAEEILNLALAGEVEAVRMFNASAEECRRLGDHGTAAVFDDMVLDEERHGDWFEAQLEAVKTVGIQSYLAHQVDVSEGL